MSEEEMTEQIASLHWAILCHEYGCLDAYIRAGNNELHEDYYSSFFDTLYAGVDFLDYACLDDEEVTKWYFCFNSMSEYYRLCRDYCSIFHVSLRQNPYMEEARHFVNEAMELGNNGGYAYVLQTRVNHKWASGLVVYTDDSYFNASYELAEALFSIGAWYTTAAEHLKKKLDEAKKEAVCA